LRRISFPSDPLIQRTYAKFSSYGSLSERYAALAQSIARRDESIPRRVRATMCEGLSPNGVIEVICNSLEHRALHGAKLFRFHRSSADMLRDQSCRTAGRGTSLYHGLALRKKRILGVSLIQNRILGLILMFLLAIVVLWAEPA
jgi:hypothetical protein